MGEERGRERVTRAADLKEERKKLSAGPVGGT